MLLTHTRLRPMAAYHDPGCAGCETCSGRCREVFSPRRAWHRPISETASASIAAATGFATGCDYIRTDLVRDEIRCECEIDGLVRESDLGDLSAHERIPCGAMYSAGVASCFPVQITIGRSF